MTILYVDDDPDDGDIFCEAINEIDSSIKCVRVLNGMESLEKLPTMIFDIIFLDYKMPLLNGKLTLREIRKNEVFQKTRVIMVYTVMDEVEKGECKKLGADDFMIKPGDFKTLCTTLRQLLSIH